MPTYDYDCPACGGFDAFRPLSERNEPVACPDCATASPRVFVTAPRLAGQLDTNISAEVELDEAAIASYGVSNVEELLTALGPQTRSGRGRGSGRPIILVNGRRIGGFGEVRNLPPEAIAKVEVFPEEVALQYGYAADERVVNLVLKPNFRQITVEAAMSARAVTSSRCNEPRAWNQAALQAANNSNSILAVNTRLANSSPACVENINRPDAAANTKPKPTSVRLRRASGATGKAAPQPNTRNSSKIRLPSSSAMPRMCATSSMG